MFKPNKDDNNIALIQKLIDETQSGNLVWKLNERNDYECEYGNATYVVGQYGLVISIWEIGDGGVLVANTRKYELLWALYSTITTLENFSKKSVDKH